MVRGLGLFISASAPSWWAAVDAFVAPVPRPMGVGVGEARPGWGKGNSRQTISPIYPHPSRRSAATSASVDEEEAEVVVIGSGIAG